MTATMTTTKYCSSTLSRRQRKYATSMHARGYAAARVDGRMFSEQGELQLDELSDLRSTFEACDSDKSGGMDLKEFVVVLKLWGVTEDPQLTATELIKGAKQGYESLGGSTKAEFQALVDSIGMPWGIEDPDVEDLELSFPEFMHLMVSGVRHSTNAVV